MVPEGLRSGVKLSKAKNRDRIRTRNRYGMRVDDSARRLARIKRAKMSKACPDCGGNGYPNPQKPNIACTTCSGDGVIPSYIGGNVSAEKSRGLIEYYKAANRLAQSKGREPIVSPALIAIMEEMQDELEVLVGQQYLKHRPVEGPDGVHRERSDP